MMDLALLTQKKEDLDADKTRGPRTSKCVNQARITMTPIWCWIDTLCSGFWFQDSPLRSGIDDLSPARSSETLR